MSETASRLTRASEPAESHTVSSESKTDTACDSLLGTVKSTFDPFKQTFSSEGGALHHVSEAVNALASVQGMPSQLLNTGIAQIPLLDKMPGMPAATIGVPHLGTPHAHAHPPSNGFPLPSVGLTIGSGCLSVLIGGIPAARVLDIGYAPTCGGLTPYFDIQTGSSNTFIGGMRAARMGIDMTRHCNPMGHVGKSGGEAASAAGKSEEVASEAAQVTGRAKALGRAGKAWSVGNAAVGPASGGATAAEDASQGEIAAAAMMAAQTAADLVFMMLSNLMGKDPGVEPSMGTLLLGNPTVLIGGFPLPDSQVMWHGAKHGVGKRVEPKLPKRPQELKCEFRGEPINPVTGDVRNDFVDYEAKGAMQFRWARYYSSDKHGHIQTLGRGFRHSWQHELHILRTRIIYVNPDGTEHHFDKRSDGNYRSHAQGYKLEQLDDLRFIVRHRDAGDVEFKKETESAAHCIKHVFNNVHSILHRGENGLLKTIEQFHEHDQTRRVIAFQYGDFERIVRVDLIDIDGSSKQISRYEYDERDCLIRSHDALGAVSTYEYGENLRIARLVDANGYAFSYRYDSSGRCIESTGQDGMWHVRFQYHPGRTIVTEGNGGKWTILCNEAGTITRVVDPYGGATEYHLDRYGSVVRETDSGGRVLRWLYDASGHNVGRMDHWGNIVPPKDDAPNLPNSLAHQVPDTTIGLHWGEEETISTAGSILLPPDLDYDGWQITSVFATSEDPPGERHDAMGRLVQRTDPHGHVERFEHDATGMLKARHDPGGGTYRYSAASWHLRGSETNPMGSTTSFRYSPNRRISTIVDPNGNESAYTYDFKNRITSVVRHGTLRETYVYDAGDRLIEKRDGAGNTLLRLEVGNDGLYSKRLLSTGETHFYGYDAFGNDTIASTDRFDVTRTFDDEHRRTSDKRDGMGIEHIYGEDGLSRTTYLGKFQVRYEMVGSGRKRIITPTGGIHHVSREADTKMLVQLGNGTNSAYTFDAAGRCTGRLIWPEACSVRKNHASYQYGETGELLRTIDGRSGVIDFYYDAAHRLIGERRDGWPIRQFAYDPGGNVLSMPTCSWMRYSEGNRLSTASSGIFRYNDRNHLAEHLTGDGRRQTYHYDGMDLLVRVEWSDRPHSWTAAYDGLCRRVETTVRDQRTSYYWDNDRLAAEIGPTGAVRIYVYVNEVALLPFMFVDYPNVDAAPETGRAYFVFCNQAGLPEWIEDERQNEVWRADDLDPYGTIRVADGHSIEYDLRWPGHWFDRETGLHYNRFRSYSPTLGRYLQSDPMGQAGGINLYAYPANPLVLVDVLGLHARHAQTNDPAPKGRDARGGEAESTELHHADPPKIKRGAKNKYPARTKEAHDACLQVYDALLDTGVSKRKMPGSIAVYTHQDGTRSVGLSGQKFSNDDAARIQDHLNRDSPGTWRVSASTEPMNTNHLGSSPERPGGIAKDNCAEPRAAAAAHQTNSKITGFDNVNGPYNENQWPLDENHPGKQEVPQRYKDKEGVFEPTQMEPCDNCSLNEGVINRFARRTSREVWH
ncbi:RHS repeat-associated core domain-containing protein [Burkholderia arboris]|uniref:RHS repeat-associated core domain-containing protein n=1 Tax=Burkholderia arboris TaxID=488730 RepID=UPI00210E4581|nr:RHS repeat-associated core domain-containing protein [Burkholderia arboris]UTV57461.1 DUF6531 domain-containing protein [Burkholderia arboris]